MITNLMALIGGISTIYSKKFWHFCACRFVVGISYDNTFVIAYILVLEYVGPKWRTFAANMSYGTFYALGAMSLPWMAYGISDWRLFAVVTAVPMAIVIVAPFAIPESIRCISKLSSPKIYPKLNIVLDTLSVLLNHQPMVFVKGG